MGVSVIDVISCYMAVMSETDPVAIARFFLEIFLLVVSIGILLCMVDHKAPGRKDRRK